MAGIILLILITPASYASVERFSDWIYDSDTLVIDNQTFRFKISQSGNNVIVSYGTENRIIGLQACKDDGKIKICVDDIEADSFGNDDSAYVTISYFEPNFTISRKANKEEVYVGDYVNFDVKVTNAGDLEAKNMIYTDYFPSDIFIDKVGGACIKNDDNSITYKANMKPGESFSCIYTVIPSKESEQKLKAQIDYQAGFSAQKVFSDTAVIESKPLYSISAYQEKNAGNISNRTKSHIELKDAEIQVGEQFTVLINISNIFSDDIDFKNFTIVFPDEMKVDKSGIDQIRNMGSWNGVIPENSTKKFYFTLTPTEGGNFEINYGATILKNKNTLSGINGKSNFEILSGELEISSNLDNLTSFDATKEMYLTFSGKNTNNYTLISFGSANISGDFLPPINVPISRIAPKESALIYQTAMLPKNITSSVQKTITLEAEYVTEYGVKKMKKKEWDITIKPIKDIEITKTLSKTAITEDDDVLVYVKVKNTRSRPIYNVRIEEIIPEGINRNGRTRASIDTLLADEKASAYNYTIKAPKVKSESKFLIKTALSYQEEIDTQEVKAQSLINVSNELNITISPKKIDLSIKKTAEYATINFGESVKVAYTVENEDTETAYNLDFIFSKDKYTDVINEYSYKIDRLEPGEIMTFKRETIKPKKHGSYYIGDTVVYFNDVDGNIFNYTLDTLSLTVQNRSVKWPSIIIAKTLSSSKITEGDALNITLSAENIGDEGADLIFKDQNREIPIYAPAKAKRNFTYSINPRHKETLTEAFAYYDYQGNEYRAYAEAPLLTINAKSGAKAQAEAIPLDNKPQENIAAAGTPGTSSGNTLLNQAWKKIKSMFGF
jgi:uncharacterized repeat protein (TIGR01451 family)